jgi:hypothetical protein
MASWVRASRAARNAVPTQAAWAPRASTAAIDDASCRHHGARRDLVDDSRHQSQGADLSTDVASGFPALGHDHIDPRLHRMLGGLHGADGVHVEGPSVVCGHCSIRFTPNEPEVPSRTRRIFSRSVEAGSQLPASIPRAPACAAAVTSSTPQGLPMGAWTTGAWIRNSSMTAVRGSSPDGQSAGAEGPWGVAEGTQVRRFTGGGCDIPGPGALRAFGDSPPDRRRLPSAPAQRSTGRGVTTPGRTSSQLGEPAAMLPNHVVDALACLAAAWGLLKLASERRPWWPVVAAWFGTGSMFGWGLYSRMVYAADPTVADVLTVRLTEAKLATGAMAAVAAIGFTRRRRQQASVSPSARARV